MLTARGSDPGHVPFKEAVLTIDNSASYVVGTLTNAFSGPTAPPHGSVPFAVAVLFIAAHMSACVTV